MKFKAAVQATTALCQAYSPGLQALLAADARRIRSKDSRKLTGSVNLDQALEQSCPDANRWDYLIGKQETSTSDRLVCVEVHPASSNHIDEVIKKARWLRNWLLANAPDLSGLRADLVWIATGSVHLQPTSIQARRLAEEGIRFPQKTLHL